MTNLTNLTMQQVIDLEYEAAKAGDLAMADDCLALYNSYYDDSSDESLSEYVANVRGEVRAIVERIVKAINDAEAQVQILQTTLQNAKFLCDNGMPVGPKRAEQKKGKL